MNLLKRPLPYKMGCDSMILWWETDSDSVTGHGLNVQLSGTADIFYAAKTRTYINRGGTNATSHFVEIEGLLPNSTTTVQVVGPGYLSTPTWSFQHVPSSEPLDFMIVNDVEGNFDDLDYLIANKHTSADCVISCGDLLSPAQDNNYDDWSKIYGSMSSFLEVAKGVVFSANDKSKGSQGSNLFPSSPSRSSYYATTIGPVRVVSLDTSKSGRKSLAAAGAQVRWFLNEINSASWKNADYRIIVGSTPPATSLWGNDGSYLDGTDRFLNKVLPNIIKSSGATLSIFGSGHSYQRGVYPSDYPGFEDIPVQYVICSGINSPHTHKVGSWTASSEPSFIISSSDRHYVKLSVTSAAMTLITREWSSDSIIDQISFSPRNLN